MSAEAFLTEFHDARPGLTAKAFGRLDAKVEGQVFRSSYDVLASELSAATPPTRVLDLACGDGYLLAALRSFMPPETAFHGVDLSTGELGLAHDRLGPAAHLCRASAQALPYADAAFDCVVCHMALMLMSDAPLVLGEVRRVMCSRSRFVAVVGAPPPASIAGTLYREALSGRRLDERWSTLRIGDSRWGDEQGIRDLLAPGFRDVRIRNISIEQRLTPQGLWRWFLDMYDLYRLEEGERHEIEQAFVSAAARRCSPDGKLDLPGALRCVAATTA